MMALNLTNNRARKIIEAAFPFAGKYYVGEISWQEKQIYHDYGTIRVKAYIGEEDITKEKLNVDDKTLENIKSSMIVSCVLNLVLTFKHSELIEMTLIFGINPNSIITPFEIPMNSEKTIEAVSKIQNETTFNIVTSKILNY